MLLDSERTVAPAAQAGISVLMAVQNAESTIVAAVRSILLQTFRAFELIIVVDGSTDATVALIESFGDPRIRVLCNDGNVGLAASLNRALDIATGRYIARMDADDVAYPDRLCVQSRFLDDHPHVDLLGGAVLMFRGDGECVGLLPVVLDDAHIQQLGRRGSFPLYHPTWMGRTAWFRRHRYDPSFRKSQDYELLLRASPSSTYENLPAVVLGYRYAVSGSLRKRLRSRRATWRAMRKNLCGVNTLGALVLGGAVVCAKALRDVWLAIAGPGAAQAAHLAPVTDDQHARWKALWQSVAHSSGATVTE